ncbi:MAG: ABC transporter substrate-binding protein, partial [Hyphomicrobiaceae bacterium]
MSPKNIDRRRVLVGAGALGAAAMLPSPARAKGSVTAAIYPGTWDEAYRSIVAPALKKTKDIDLALEPLFAVDQIAKAQAARGAPPFDAFVLDPGPRASAIDRGLFEK